MKPATSVFLDALRVFAALLVFAYHCGVVLYADNFSIPAHEAVVIFFVLSGYVIAFSTLGRRDTTAKHYIIARLSRLYSVVIPALILTAVTMVWGNAIDPAAYEHIVRPYDFIRFIASGLFMQSLWQWNLAPNCNGPFWSLGYEFWYYVMFGIGVFGRSFRGKVAGVLACALLVGPNVLLLLPIWLFGVALYCLGDKFPLPRRTAAAIFFAVLLITILFGALAPDYPRQIGTAPLFYASTFLTDWIFGLGVGVLIWAFDQAWGSAPVSTAWETAIRWAANHTFSLYLFHMPLILFYNALGFFNPSKWWSAALEIACVLATVIVLSEITESKRKHFQTLVRWIWESLARLRRRESPAVG